MMDRIAVLCGGDGAEREVSLRSGAAVRDALLAGGICAETVDLTSLDQVAELVGFDKAFVAMHGDWGEDGRLQARLEAAGIPYTGSGPRACELAMDKWRARELFEEAGLTVPKGRLSGHGDEELGPILAVLGPDVVVKPCQGGSTVGVTILRGATPEDMARAIELARRSYDGDVMIETYIEGRELTVAVWEREGVAQALPAIEIVPKAGFYDYAHKYTAGATDYVVPASLDADMAASLADAAVRAHIALGCSAYSRADFRLSTDGRLHILEINTAPGMTETSLVPKAARAAGTDMQTFVAHILSLARAPKR